MSMYESGIRELERQVGGDHYKKLKTQPINFILDNELGWCEGNAVKYITRWHLKGGTQDIQKAIHYLEILLERQVDRSQLVLTS